MNERVSRWGARVWGQIACAEVGGVRAAAPGERERSTAGRRGKTDAPKAPTASGPARPTVQMREQPPSFTPCFSLQARAGGRATLGFQSWRERQTQQEGGRSEPEHLSAATPQSAADVAAGTTLSEPGTSGGALSPPLEAQGQ